jgi:hypothetical protein
VTCAGHVRKVHNAGGIPDLIVDGGHAARLLREQESNVECPAGLAGYEGAREPIASGVPFRGRQVMDRAVSRHSVIGLMSAR